LNWRLDASHRNFFKRIEQFARKVVNGRSEHADAGCELVVGNHRRNGDKKPGRGGD